AGGCFFLSPSLIGCCFAMHRDLYAEILGMDSDMQQWGVEDLDLGMKAWLFDAPVLTDAEVVIGHRFRRTFDNFTVEHAHILANELRFARKHFEDRAWKQWLNARRSSMPVNAWQAGWDLFETNLTSIEAEKNSLQSRRVHDEYWYAKQFGLNWPGRDAESVPRSLAMLQMSGGNPSEMPSPEPSVEPSEGPSSSAGSSYSSGSQSETSSWSKSGDEPSNGSSFASSGESGESSGSNNTSQSNGSGDSSANSSNNPSSSGNVSSASSPSSGESNSSFSGSNNSSNSTSSEMSNGSNNPSSPEGSSTTPNPSSNGGDPPSGDPDPNGSSNPSNSGSSSSVSPEVWLEYWDYTDETMVGTTLGHISPAVKLPANTEFDSTTATFELVDDFDGKYVLDTITDLYTPQMIGRITLAKEMEYQFGDDDHLEIRMVDDDGLTAICYLAIGDENDLTDFDYKADFNPDNIPLERIDSMVDRGEALRYGHAVVIPLPTGHIVLESQMNVVRLERDDPFGPAIPIYGITHYRLAGISPAPPYGTEAAADAFVNGQMDQIAADGLVFFTEFLLGLLPGGATADELLQGNTEAAIRYGVGDLLLTSLVFAKAFKASGRLIYGLSAANLAYDAVDTAYEGYLAYEAFNTDPNSGGLQAGITLLRLVGVTLSAKELKLLEKLKNVSNYHVSVYRANPGSVYVGSGLGPLQDLRLKISPTRARKSVVTKTAEEINSLHPPHYHAPYKPGTKVLEFETGREEIFLRFHGEDNQVSRWVCKFNAVKGLTADEIWAKYQIPDEVTHMSIVKVPEGTKMRSGTVHQGINQVEKFKDVPEWDRRSKQYEILSDPKREWFSEEMIPADKWPWIES
ncbi:MAG: hypothetical protein CMN21_08735, partial [Rubinisphaera sp.]|uniref:glycosyltransferase family 2 protein n=1 Tax=Rubinisphaera sp. TaxID=2024857 RepID=UPI000C111317